MTFLITGITSYIASYVALKLLENGHRVIGISRTPPEIVHSRFQWIEFDLSNGYPKIVWPVDMILHMAAMARLNQSASQYYESNICITHHVESMARRLSPDVIFYTSSMKVYGDIQSSTVCEDTPVINPDLYGISKYFGEKLLEEAGNTLSIRMPNTIAPGSNGWINSIYKKLQTNEPISLINSPYNHTLHPLDIYRFIDTIIQKKLFLTDQYNLCASGLMTSLEVVRHMKHKLGASSAIEWTENKNFHTLSNHKVSQIFTPMTVLETIDLYLQDMGQSGN